MTISKNTVITFDLGDMLFLEWYLTFQSTTFYLGLNSGFHKTIFKWGIHILLLKSAIYKQNYHLHDFHNISNYCDVFWITYPKVPPLLHIKWKNIYSNIRYIIFKIFLYFATFFCTLQTCIYIFIYICINVIIFQKVGKFKYKGCLLSVGLQLNWRVLV